MHRSKHDINVGQKAAQLGYTETVLNITFYKIDVESVDCLYVLPNKNPDAGEFSAGRFDPALELSPHLSTLFSDVKNVGHKRAGSTNLYIRGSKSRAGLKSIPTGLLVMDEVDEMNQDNISLARERMSGQRVKQEWLISTPTIDYYGINKYFTQSTQEHYHIKCPSCSKHIALIFPDNLVITGEDPDDPNTRNSHLICTECQAILPHATKPDWLMNGAWIPKYQERDIRGFYINQLYSTTVSPVDLAKAFLRSKNDPADEQTFYNDKIGIPHIVEGARITEYQLEQAKGSYLNSETKPASYLITMGIDVGRNLHYEIDSWYIPNNLNLNHDSLDFNVQCKVKVLEVGKLQHFEELDILMRKWRVLSAVIDANPERRKAYEFASRFAGHTKLCFYGAGIVGKQINEPKNPIGDEPTITVDRTSWLDLSLGRYRNQSITIPSNIPNEYKDHLKALTRIYEKDREGNPVGRYVKGNNDDHYAHARNYAEIALKFAVAVSSPYSITSPL